VKIAIDLDGVLYPWHLSLYHHLQIYEDLQDDYDIFWTETIHTYSEMRGDFLINIQYLYGNQVPKAKDLELLKQWSKSYTLFYITARPTDIETITKLYLKRWDFPQRNNVFFAADKSVVMNYFGIDILIDDSLKNINSISSDKRGILVKQPWNNYGRDYSPSVNSFAEIVL
jgi:uncharacterized HAD superfamily protein